MKVATYAGIVQNGQIRLTDQVRLPEMATVYVVVPGVDTAVSLQVTSPRLMHPEQAVDFAKEVVVEADDAGV